MMGSTDYNGRTKGKVIHFFRHKCELAKVFIHYLFLISSTSVYDAIMLKFNLELCKKLDRGSLRALSRLTNVQ